MLSKRLLFCHCAIACILAPLELKARTYLSLGYGLQLHSLANKTLAANVNKMATNSGAVGMTGISGLAPYSTNWSLAPQPTEFAFVGLPELRVNTDWSLTSAGRELGRVGFFASASGGLPQTIHYYSGSTTLKETNICTSTDYAKCPLAASGFVTAGSGSYSGELRSSLRFFNLAVGFTFAKNLLPLGKGGDLVLGAELGLALQSFAVTTQWAFARCTTGAAIPCANLPESRVHQGEIRQQAVYALGPVIGASVRYERTNSFWFAELALQSTFLFSKIESNGYTNFVAAGTVAFTQSSTVQGVSDSESVLIILPAAVLRLGVYF